MSAERGRIQYPKRAAIDIQALQTPSSRNRGIGVYTRQLLQTLFDLNQHPIEWTFVLLNLAPTVDPGLQLRSGTEMYPAYIGPNGLLLRRQVGSVFVPSIVRSFLRRSRPSLFYVTSPFDRWNIFDRRLYGDLPVVATVYDLVPLIYESEYLDSDLARRSYMGRLGFIRQCDHLVAISRTVKSDLEHRLGIPPMRISVVYPGLRDDLHRAPVAADRRVLARLGISKEFVLSVGGDDFRKNLPRLLEAFARLPGSIREGHNLVIISHLGERAETLQALARDFGIAHLLVLPGHVTDEQLRTLYFCGKVLVFPSLYEGFGLPLLEAMACGMPVVTANTSALVEVAADAALLVDPLDPTSMEVAMRRILQDEGLRGGLRERGLARARMFQWTDSARDLLAIFEEVLAARR